MHISDSVKSLLQNDKELCTFALNTLLKIANNIINHPNEARFRRINLNSEVTEKSLLPAVGALEILFLMGFEEGSDKLLLPDHASLDILTSYRDQLEQLKRENITEKSSDHKGKPTPQKDGKKRVLTDAEIARYMLTEEEMRNELEHQFRQVLVFESPHLQEEARKAMPYQALNKKAKEREALLKRENESIDRPLDFQDCILIELLAWFKADFFTWFDHGYCETCSQPMKFVGHVPPNEEEREFGGHRVEKNECESCSSQVRFPRYFHPGKLLSTRRGRCMEWASCFTLMCRALGLDARYILDETDHVWTEVFSLSQNRWLHADPCENKLDSPLMYEKGWNKELSYIFAFSKDEIVDCVWRYSADHKAICKRRKRCREDWLIATLYSMNEERQRNFPEPKKNFLQMRLVREVAEFFTQPKVTKEGEFEGRISGSLSWRLSRGETDGADSAKNFEPFTFVVSDEEAKAKEFVVKYSSSQDVYIRESSNCEKISGWRNAAFRVKNVHRKHEKDWKMVYLARTEGSEEGELTWRIEWGERGLQVQSVLVVLQHKTYEDGVVHWQLCTGDSCFPGNEGGVLQLTKEAFDDTRATYLELSTTLSKGKGGVAWQHAQLFRQKDDHKEFPFYVKIQFE